MNKWVKNINEADLYKEFLTSLNGILDLTGRELELLTELTNIDVNTVKTPKESKNVVSTANRKYLRKKLGITPDNLSRYITKFKNQGILVGGKLEDEVVVNKALIPIIIGDRVQITIVLRINKENNDSKNTKS